jgi:hypothetical protein
MEAGERPRGEERREMNQGFREKDCQTVRLLVGTRAAAGCWFSVETGAGDAFDRAPAAEATGHPLASRQARRLHHKGRAGKAIHRLRRLPEEAGGEEYRIANRE